MGISVEIEIDDAGKISVGVMPPEEDQGAGGGVPGNPLRPEMPAAGGQAGPEQEDQGMHPAASIDEALMMAKALLEGKAAPPEQEDAQFAQGYQKGAGPMAGMNAGKM